MYLFHLVLWVVFHIHVREFSLNVLVSWVHVHCSTNRAVSIRRGSSSLVLCFCICWFLNLLSSVYWMGNPLVWSRSNAYTLLPLFYPSFVWFSIWEIITPSIPSTWKLKLYPYHLSKCEMWVSFISRRLGDRVHETLRWWILFFHSMIYSSVWGFGVVDCPASPPSFNVFSSYCC